MNWLDAYLQYKIAEAFIGVFGILVLLAWYYREKKKLRKK